MLLLSGVIPQKDGSEKVYNNEVVSANELISLFGLEEYFANDLIYFHLTNNLYYVNPITKIEQVSSGIMLQTFVSGVYNGQEITLRYYRTNFTRQSKSGGSYIDYQPKRINRIEKKVNVVNLVRDREIAVYMFLHPKNQDSPIQGDTDRSYYVVDPEKEARESIEFEKMIDTIRAEIWSTPAEELRNKVMGFAYDKLLRISKASSMSETKLRDILIKKIKDNPKHFIKAWITGGTNRYQPIIQKAYDLGVITNQINNDEIVVMIPPSIYDNTRLKSQVIVKCNHTDDVYRKIEKHLINNKGVFEFIILEMQKKEAIESGALDQSDDILNETVESAEKKFRSWLEKNNASSARIDFLIDYAFSYDVLYLDRMSGVVYHIDDNGDLEGEGFAEVKDVKNYKTELKNLLNNNDEQKAEFKEKVFAKLQSK